MTKITFWSKCLEIAKFTNSQIHNSQKSHFSQHRLPLCFQKQESAMTLETLLKYLKNYAYLCRWFWNYSREKRKSEVAIATLFKYLKNYSYLCQWKWETSSQETEKRVFIFKSPKQRFKHRRSSAAPRHTKNKLLSALGLHEHCKRKR